MNQKIKTCLEVFYEKFSSEEFPKLPKRDSGVPIICPEDIFLECADLRC